MAPGRRSCRCAKNWPAERWQRSRTYGHIVRRNNSKEILSRFDALCTASAVNAHELADRAASTESATLVRLALHLERISCELHAIGQVLPAALMLTCTAGQAGEP